MIKKELYAAPEIEVHELCLENHILGGSPTPEAPGGNASGFEPENG